MDSSCSGTPGIGDESSRQPAPLKVDACEAVVPLNVSRKVRSAVAMAAVVVLPSTDSYTWPPAYGPAVPEMVPRTLVLSDVVWTKNV